MELDMFDVVRELSLLRHARDVCYEAGYHNLIIIAHTKAV